MFYRTGCYTARMFWNHVVLQDRSWSHEMMKDYPSEGDYYFSDTPLSCEEFFPGAARGEIARE